MAWIVKNSGGMQVEKRDEPYLDDAFKAELTETFLHRYPRKQAATIPILHEVQHKIGYLPFQAIEEVAAFLDLPPSTVMDTATFYEEFFLEPVGKYVLWICQSVSCEIMGEPTLTQKIAEHLGIEPGETTEDGKFTLMKAECLGVCGGAPVALVNHAMHENLTPENFVKVLDALE